MVNQNYLLLPEENLKERIKELQGKIQLRTKDKQVVCAVSNQMINENENEIKALKEEVREMVLMEQKCAGPQSEQNIISKGLQDCRRSQLAFQRLSVDQAINSKKNQFFDKVNELNHCIYKKFQLEKRLQQLKDQANWLPPEDATAAKAFEQKKRVLGAMEDKMKLKAASAKFVEKLYKQIINRMKYDRLEQPRRLQQLEARVKDLRFEINSCWLTTLIDSKQTYKNAKQLQDQVESTFLKEKRSRDKSIAEMRKRFKNLKFMNAYEDREIKLRKQKTVLTLASNSGCEDIIQLSRTGDVDTKQSGFNKVEFQQLREAMDRLYEKTSVKKLSDVAGCLEAQADKFKDLISKIKTLGERKENLMLTKSKLEKNLEKKKLSYQSMLDETHKKKTQLEAEIITKTDLAKRRKKRVNQLQSLHISVTEAIDELATTIKSWEMSSEEKEISPDDEKSAPNVKFVDQKIKKRESFINDDIEPTMKTTTDSKKLVIKSSSSTSTVSDIDSLNKLYNCCDRLMEITRSASQTVLNQSAVSILQELRDIASHEQNYEMMVTMQSKNRKSRVSFGLIQNFYMENFLYHDHLDNDEFLSRETIKEMSKSIVWAKQPKRKSKTK